MAHADALIANRPARAERRAHDTTKGASDLEALLRLAERIERAMPGTAPSEQYVPGLRRRLLESEQAEAVSVWTRVRQLPPHTQLAAGIGGATLTAGVVILAVRSVYDVLGNRRNRRTVTV